MNELNFEIERGFKKEEEVSNIEKVDIKWWIFLKVLVMSIDFFRIGSYKDFESFWKLLIFFVYL